MNLAELKQKLVAKSLDSLYIFSGEEVCIMGKYVESITRASGKKAVRLDSVKELFPRLTNSSFLKVNNVFIIRDDKEFLTAENRWNLLEKLIKEHIVILLFTNLDKRKSFYKRYKDTIVEFDKLTPAQLLKYVQKEITLRDQFAISLISFCNNDYGRIISEIDKIKCLAESRNSKAEVVYLDCMKEKLIYEEPKQAVFDFVDCVLRKDAQQSFKLWRGLQQLKTSEILILSLLYMAFRQVLIVQGSKVRTAEKTGLTGWIIKNTLEKINYYNIEDLIEILKIIQKTESGIKRGEIDVEISVEYCLIRIFNYE
jgi:DNA polymerase III delta subunit